MDPHIFSDPDPDLAELKHWFYRTHCSKISSNSYERKKEGNFLHVFEQNNKSNVKEILFIVYCFG